MMLVVFGGTTTPAATVTTPATTPANVPSGQRLTRSLVYGTIDSEVNILQTWLALDPSIYPSGQVTGYFGPATLRAVKLFQVKYGIAKSGQAGYGNVGPATRAKLNELYAK
jgi:peptidoglycan hydrolase-like protein with peptidoglycan-binding domain